MSSKKLPVPTLADTQLEFSFIAGSSVEGVRGVWVADSRKPGPVLGITMQTHGNEPSGLAAMWYFRRHFNLQERLQKGKVIFVLNNVKGAANYFAAGKIKNPKKRDLAKRRARIVDFNFNRLPEDVFALANDERYEIKRVQELRPVWEMFDVGLDIHSTSQESDAMIVACDGFRKELVKGFPIEVIVTSIDKVQLGQPAISFYGKRGKISAFGIETGFHEAPTSFERATSCVLALMRNLKMISGGEPATTSRYREYRIAGAVILPTSAYEMVKEFEPFERITKGQVLARGNGTDIVAEFDGHGLLAPKRRKPEFYAEEMMFLSHPVKKITL